MLPGNLQYWQPSRWFRDDGIEMCGTKSIKIDEPIHFSGPSPGEQSAIAVEEEMKEVLETSQPVKLTVTDHDDPLGPAQQSSTEEISNPVQKVKKEETKEPEPSSTVEPADEAELNPTFVDYPLKVNQQPIATVQQSADANQVTLQAFQGILAQQLRE